MKHRLLLSAWALVLGFGPGSPLATAQTVPGDEAVVRAPAPGVRTDPPAGVIGASTRRWLELQRSNAEAGRAHPMDGEVANLVYRRYLDSFRTPLTAPGGPASSSSGLAGAAAASTR